MKVKAIAYEFDSSKDICRIVLSTCPSRKESEFLSLELLSPNLLNKNGKYGIPESVKSI